MRLGVHDLVCTAGDGGRKWEEHRRDKKRANQGLH